jgi:hypothetical protein
MVRVIQPMYNVSLVRTVIMNPSYHQQILIKTSMDKTRKEFSFFKIILAILVSL